MFRIRLLRAWVPYLWLLRLSSEHCVEPKWPELKYFTWGPDRNASHEARDLRTSALCVSGAASIFTPRSLGVSRGNRLETAVMFWLLLALWMCSSLQACPNETPLLSCFSHSLRGNSLSMLISIASERICYTLLWCSSRTVISALRVWPCFGVTI